MNENINAGLADAGIKARLTELGAAALVLSSVETEKWGAVIRAAHIKPV